MNLGRKLKKISAISLAGILAAGVLASCGTDNTNNSASPATTSSVSADSDDKNANDNNVTSTFTPKADDKTVGDAESTVIPQTAEEAADDVDAIANEIASLEELITAGNFDDAMMQIRALLTKNLSDAQKAVVETYQKQIQDRISDGLTD